MNSGCKLNGISDALPLNEMKLLITKYYISIIKKQYLLRIIFKYKEEQMKDPSILIYSHFFICMGFGIVQWIFNDKFNMLTKLSYLYMIVATILLSIVITDSIIDAIFSIIFGFLIMFAVQISNKELKSRKLWIFIVSIAVATTMFIFISRFVLVKPTSLMFIYLLSSVYVFNRTKNQPIKYRTIGAIGFSIILLAGLFYNSDKTNQYPTKQSFAAIDYMEQNYVEENYTIYSRDSMRGSKTVITIYMDSTEKTLLLEYENSSIINVIEN